MNIRYRTIKTEVVIFLLGLNLVVQSCKKIVEVDSPSTSVNSENVYSNDATAISTVTGLYIFMNSSSVFAGRGGFSLQSGLSSDELSLSGNVSDARLIAYYQNSLSPIAHGSDYWGPLYTLVFRCNSAIEGLSTSTALSSAVKQQLLGEALLVRAFSFFYLVNYFGDVPMPLSSDYKVNSLLNRTSISKVYQQIISDLLEAQSFLSENYLDGSLKNYSTVPERVRPTKWAATALLARVYLYAKEYSKAEAQANLVIDHSIKYGLNSNLNGVFLKNSNEAIWQLQPVTPATTTEDALFFVINAPQSNSKPVYLSTSMLGSFEANDRRKAIWTKDTIIGDVRYTYPYKYTNATLNSSVTEYLMVLRLSEQYLIRAEARAHLNNLTGAIDDLDRIRGRALLPLIATTNSTISQSELLAIILHERRVELFSEWAHRWLDLKRTDKVDAVMAVETISKGGVWNSTQKLYPISMIELQRNPNLVQNPGY